MKFPRFIKVPRHKRFNITPRYYDPIKEDIEIRTEKIRREINNPNLANVESNIRDSFERKVTRESNAGLLRLIIFATICGMIAGYLFLGTDIFYAVYLLIPIYVYFRLKGRAKRK